MQPYQTASDEYKRQSEIPGEVLKKGATTALSIAGGRIALNRVLPLLSKFVPGDITTKGLTKIDPRFGKFIKSALLHGNNMDEVKEFIKEKIEPSKAKLSPSGFPIKENKTPEMASTDEEAGFEPPKQKKQSLTESLMQDYAKQYGDNDNIINQYNPDLYLFLKSKIKSGASPIQAATEAAKSGKYSQAIQQMQNDHKTGWGHIVQTIFGGAKNQSQTQQPNQQPNEQVGKGQQALMQSMQQLTQLLGKGK